MSLKGVELRLDQAKLSGLTTMRIGGLVRRFFVVHSLEDLAGLLIECGNDFYLLGGGSNLLVKDCVIEKPVVTLGREFSYVKDDSGLLEIGAATHWPEVVKYCVKNSLGGLEELVGIPAQVGGMIAMNSSASGQEISGPLVEAEIVDSKGQLIRLKKSGLGFGYRTSSLKQSIVARAWFKLEKKAGIREAVMARVKKRFENQDFSFPSCGCIFKNPQETSAGKLIDDCGFKGVCKGGAKVSTKHANFIINIGKAKYDDVDYLIQTIKEKVFSKYGLLLEEEIKRWE